MKMGEIYKMNNIKQTKISTQNNIFNMMRVMKYKTYQLLNQLMKAVMKIMYLVGEGNPKTKRRNQKDILRLKSKNVPNWLQINSNIRISKRKQNKNRKLIN